MTSAKIRKRSRVAFGHCNRSSHRGDICSHEGGPNHGVTHFDNQSGYRWREERRIEPEIAEQLVLGKFTEDEIRKGARSRDS